MTRVMCVLLLLVGCNSTPTPPPDSDTDTDTDTDTDSDTDTDTDADTDPDPVSTTCPPTPDLVCDRATEACLVAGPIGPTEISSCETLPSGCENDRTCACMAEALCPNPADTCSERADNTIYCDNGSQ